MYIRFYAYCISILLKINYRPQIHQLADAIDFLPTRQLADNWANEEPKLSGAQ
ncbi:MAG: hypothetical protein PF489_04500 [Salinivirgaceae bacterium]|jgi:flagellin-specific chaperone FliS|nr:hypothetical protein [Salinivirgaceae bacterium]